MAEDSSVKSKSEDRSLVSQKVLFVRNLPFTTTDQDLENLFSEVGPIKRSFVIRDKGAKSLCRGFGYVTFALADDAQRAIDVVKTFGGRQLSVCFADKKPKHEKRKMKQAASAEVDDDANNKDKEVEEMSPDDDDEEEMPPKKKLKSSEQEEKIKTQKRGTGRDIGRTVVLTKLATDLNQNHIRKKCRKIGPVEKVTYPVEGREEPTAFVIFQSHKDAREAVQKLNGKMFKGNFIEVSLLSREGKQPNVKSLKKSKVIIRNLSFKCKEDDIKKFFSQFGQITDVHIPTKLEGKRKRSLGFGFVQFSSVFEAAKAIKEANMKEIAGRPVAVDWALSKTVYQTKKGHEDENTETGHEDKEKNKLDEDEEDADEASGSGSDADSGEENLDNSDSEGEEEGEDKDSDEEFTQRETLQIKKPKQLSDVKEGKTLFIRNISFDTSEDSLQELFEQFGEVDYCKLLEDKRTGHSRGMAFVKYKTVESAEECLEEASKEGSALSLDNFTLNVTKAVTRGKAAELAKEKKIEGNREARDNRNLYLAKEGLILSGSTAAQGLSKADLLKRQKAEKEKKAKLENPNYFVSKTRLCVRNLALNVDDSKLKEIFSTATGRRIHVEKVLIIRSKDRLDGSGRGRSMGFGFVEFANHKDALAALRATNNNPAIFGADRRPIVEFSIENSLVLKTKQRRVEKAQHRQQQGTEEHARDGQPKTNKERRLEKNQKRREKRQRKREAKKKRKLEQTKDGEGAQISEQSKETKKAEKRASITPSKAKNVNFSPRTDFAGSGKLKPDKRNQQKRRQFSVVPANENKSDTKPSTINNKSSTRPKLSKVKKTPKNTRDVDSSLNKTPGIPDRKRKGAWKKEQEKKDESKFSEMVSKYKNKLFGMDESESSAKRSRWFQ
ncbi:RNA-binding protein 28-like isoform X2 [Oculina patagonica]